MKKIALLIFVLFFAGVAFGQSDRGYIYLKSGTVLKGKFNYSEDMKKMQVQSGGNTWVFDVEEVDRVSRMRSKTALKPDTMPPSRFFNLTEIGVLAGNSDNSQSAPFIFGTSLNYQFHRSFSAGVGLGAEFLKETYLPVTANLIYRLRTTRFSPFAMLQAGYELPIEDSRMLYYEVVPDWWYSSSSYWIGPWPNSTTKLKAKGGILLNPSVGFIQYFNSGFGMSLSFGYRFHRLSFDGENGYRVNIDYNRLSVKLGIIIK